MFSENLSINVTFWRFLPQVQIILVVILGRVEGHHRPNLSDRMIAHLHQFAKNLDGRIAFRGVVEPNGGKVLRTDIDTLAVDLLEIVDLEEIAH